MPIRTLDDEFDDDDDDDARARAPARGRIVARAAPTDAGATTDMTTTTVSDEESRRLHLSSQPSLASIRKDEVLFGRRNRGLGGADG